MDKRIGMIGMAVFCILAVVVCYGFFSMKSEKKAALEKRQGLGMPFPEMMNQLGQNMGVWSSMSKDEKKAAVDAIISLNKTRENVAILNGADFYINKIDDTLKNNPPVVALNVMTLVRILAIMDYDYYNGQNKDELARQTLGEKAYKENQQRRQAEEAQRQV